MSTEIQLLQMQLKQRNRELKASYKYAEGLEMEIEGHEFEIVRLTHRCSHHVDMLVDRDVTIRNLRERNKEQATTIAGYMGDINLIKDIVA